MNILITNDDGIFSKGLKILVQNLLPNHDLTVVAPSIEMSGASHSFTIFSPLFIKEIGLNGNLTGYAINGTPSDCIKIAIRKLVKQPPDLIISGINSGENTGVSSFYSGTVAGAREGVFFGIRSISVSLSVFSDGHIRFALKWLDRFLEKIQEGTINFNPKTTYLNINFPSCTPDKIAGTKITRQGISPFNDDYEERKNPNGQPYFWLFGDRPCANDSGVDEKAIEDNYITVTPLTIDMTDYNFLKDYSDKGNIL